MENININNDFKKICEILDKNNVSYIIYSDTENIFTYMILIRLFGDNKESSMQILFNNNHNIASLTFINNNYKSQIKHYQYLIDCKEIKLIKDNHGEKVHYSLYLSDDNIKYEEKYYNGANIYTAFNRYGIPIEIAYVDNNLYEISIISKDNIDKNEINIKYEIGTDIPCIIISSLINYILKVN